MPPAAKRARSDDGAATVAEWSKKVKCLSKETSHALLAGLMTSLPVVREIVEAEIAKVEPVDLRVYSSRASSIVSSLDGLRASQQYQRSGEVLERLVELVDTCKVTRGWDVAGVGKVCGCFYTLAFVSGAFVEKKRPKQHAVRVAYDQYVSSLKKRL